MYDGGGDDFTAIQNETTFDYKKLGAEMLTGNFDLDRSGQRVSASARIGSFSFGKFVMEEEEEM